MRTDIHSPKNISPKDYVLVGLQYVGPSHVGHELQLDYVNPLENHMKRTGGTFSDHNHGGTCHVCGAHAHYLAVYYHKDTNTYIRTGFDCASKMDMQDQKAFKRFTKKVHDARDFVAGKQKALKTLEDAGLGDCWTIWQEPTPDFFEEATITDIVSKLIRYGSISSKQEAFLAKLLKQINERGEKIKKEREEWENAAPCPEGRVVIVGEVLSVKWRDTIYGSVKKMRVRAKEGFVVWGTVPSEVKLPNVLGEEEGPSGIQKGDIVKFHARVKPSEDDKKFGVFSRPTKAEVIESGESNEY